MGEPVEIFKTLERNSEGTVIHRESFLVDSDYLERVLESTFPEYDDTEDFLSKYTPEEEGVAIYELALDDGEIQNEASYSIGDDEEDYGSLLDYCDDLSIYSDDVFDSNNTDDFDDEDDFEDFEEGIDLDGEDMFSDFDDLIEADE